MNDESPFSSNVLADFAFYNLFLRAEKVRWDFSDIKWDQIDKTKVSAWDREIARELAWTEITTFSATSSFLNQYKSDLDFSQWLCIWFYEESKHPFVLMKWLEAFGETFDSNYIETGRTIHPMRESKIESLTLNVVSEIIANVGYSKLAEITEEPVLKDIYKRLSGDEFRHAMGFYTYAKQSLENCQFEDTQVLSVLQLLRLCLYSRSQKHPVRDAATRIQENYLKKIPGKADFALNLEDEAHKKTLNLFSSLLNIKFETRLELENAVQNLKIKILDKKNSAKN